MTLKALIFSIIFVLGCNKSLIIKKTFSLNKKQIEKTIDHWHYFIKHASNKYDVDEKLIKSIIYVESSGNPFAKSSSNAIGLMQIKASAAGLDIYRLNGKQGQPSLAELYNPRININIGTSYISLLQKKNLFGIKNKEIMRYATIVSYVNGANALLKMFSKDKNTAIKIINTMTINTFFKNMKKHPSKQASNYLEKVIKIYKLI
ncbi:murein transglycosylase [Buchnera aphidicola (Aphis helianthi)]|uniref:peptidoglycan lytic exotransglycosylase n=1 Tax=Buchnera aphidicola (Aphis helianthi) TaxID=2315802 RepID=A0A4D6XWJ4_9GAMM|nr:transglycosylase SLT domain-containing protein [Buchnera aphidicola]QCI17085.1 murein transglycosylase [Buchnera aphidicola (Aphis helianthi)]